MPPSLRVFTREAAAPAPQMAQLPPPAIAFPPNGAVLPLPDDIQTMLAAFPVTSLRLELRKPIADGGGYTAVITIERSREIP